MPLPTRNTAGVYRYAYQGQEKDLETGMEAFELRLWDARIGRWLTTDPYGEFYSPYLGMANNPVSTTDPDGGCTICPDFFMKFLSNFTTPVDGSLGHDPIFPHTGGIQGLEEVLIYPPEKINFRDMNDTKVTSLAIDWYKYMNQNDYFKFENNRNFVISDFIEPYFNKDNFFGLGDLEGPTANGQFKGKKVTFTLINEKFITDKNGESYKYSSIVNNLDKRTNKMKNYETTYNIRTRDDQDYTSTNLIIYDREIYNQIKEYIFSNHN